MWNCVLGMDGDILKRVIPEKDIQRAIKDYLQILKNQGKLMFIRNNSGAMPIKGKNGKMRYIKFGEKGSADILLFVPLYLTNSIKTLEAIALEVKKIDGVQSADQKKWQANWERLGGAYYIVRCLEDVIKIIRLEEEK